MNPNIKKQFILEAWEYNAQLATPFTVSYSSDTSYYVKNNYLSFIDPKPNDQSMKYHNYEFLVEKEITSEINQTNSRTLVLTGANFIAPYFKHFFIKHTHLQLDLLKFFNTLLSHVHNVIDFINGFEKKEMEPLLTNVNHWYSYNTPNLKSLQSLMVDKSFNEGFRVSILKKYIQGNLKNINKHPNLSKDLEDFIMEHYPQDSDLLAQNVVAIKSRLQAIDQDLFKQAFNKKPVYCITDNILNDTLLKTFQISGWNHSSYNRVIHIYHDHLKTVKDFNIQAHTSTNQKETSVFIMMKNNDYTIDDYKKDIFVLLNFYRNHPEHSVNIDNVTKIFFNQKMQESLVPANKKQKATKI